jgi:hypothetical protein
MRLLDSRTLELEEFIGSDIPPYAILSHTWGEEEVALQDLQSKSCESKTGYDKIEKCCQAASADGFEDVWIDTCCIDKTSSSELSEVINSMFRWYRDYEVCYVILSDVDGNSTPAEIWQLFKSRWFTRGWTLQELVAPSSLTFFNKNWEDIGTKISLQPSITKITGIPKGMLLGNGLWRFSVAQIMSWASRRRTTTVEDIAYCLMGIFGVNMPMLYGEGDNAFLRLQEEIIKTFNDHSIFAWKMDYWGTFNGELLATSPAAFRESGHLEVHPEQYHDGFSLTKKGLRLELPLKHFGLSRAGADTFIAILACNQAGDEKTLLGFACEQIEGTSDRFRRVTKDKLFVIERKEVDEGLGIECRIMYFNQRFLRETTPPTMSRPLYLTTTGLEIRGIFLYKTVGTYYDMDHHRDDTLTRVDYNAGTILRFRQRGGQHFDVALRITTQKCLIATVIIPLEHETVADVSDSFKQDQNIGGEQRD